MTVSFPVIQGGNSHRSPHSFAEDLGRGAVRSLLLGTRRVITRVIGTSSAEGVEITGGHLPSPAASPPLAFHPQRQLGFLPSPRGTVPFPSPRQHGGEGAQPRKSPAKLPGSFGMGGRYKEEAPTRSFQGTSRQVGAQPSWCPTCPQNAFSRRQVSGQKVPQAEPTAAHAVGSVSGDPLGLGDGGCEEALASLSQPGPASLNLRGHFPAGDSGLPTKHLLCANTLLGPEDANGDKSTGSCLRSAASLLELSTLQARSCLCTSQKFTKHLLCARHCQAKLGKQLNLKKCEHM